MKEKIKDILFLKKNNMENIKKTINKCKIDFKKKGNKIILVKQGYCDDSNPNIIVKHETEFLDFNKLEEV